MSETALRLHVSVQPGEDADPEYIAGLSRQLSDDLLELDAVQSVTPGFAEIPLGAKGAGMDFGALMVNLVGASGFAALATSLIGWVSRDRSRTLKLSVNNASIELTGLSASDQQALVDWFKTQAAKPAPST